MSNLGGSVNLREQERRARLLLLDGIRETSPQPIFGEPVKVESEDETSRRIKNTLGDVTEVLMNEPKSLMCISRSNQSSGYPSNGHQVPGHSSSSHPMSLVSSSHSISGHPSSSHQMSGHSNSLIISGNGSNNHAISGSSSNSHILSGPAPNSNLSGPLSSSHTLSGNQSSSHMLTGNQSNTHLLTGHQLNAHLVTGHSSNNNNLIFGHSSSSHSITGQPINSSLTGHSSSHLISGHTANSNLISGNPTTGHPGHSSNSHPILGHPLNIHSVAGHSTNMYTGQPSDGYHMIAHPINVPPIPGHPITGFTVTSCPGAAHVSVPSRPQTVSKKVPVSANNNNNISKIHNPSMPNIYSKTTTDKRNTYNKQKPDSPVPLKPLYNTSSFNTAASSQNLSVQQSYQIQDTKTWSTDQKKPNTPFSVNINFNGGNYNTVTISDVSMSNVSTCAAPIWSCGPETPAIQMNPFHLPFCATPSSANKPVYNIHGQNDMTSNGQPVEKLDPVNNTPPKRPIVRPSHLKIEKKSTSPIAVETILKEMTKPVPAPLTAIQTPRTEETGFAFPPEPKEELSFVKVEEQVISSNPHQEQMPMDIFQPSLMPYTSSLQDDLEMSDSDEEVVPYKKDDSKEYLKSPSNNPSIVNNTSTPVGTTNMDANSVSSSSSESGESDSEDDSSESNNSDSSSDSSDEDTSSMKWGLSNFVDESRRNHSPAFRNIEMQKQLNNVKSKNGSVLKDNFSSPDSQPLSKLISVDTPVATKSEVLSPIRSPAHPVVGPHTPPSPACSSKELSERNEVISSSAILHESSLLDIKCSDALDSESEKALLSNTLLDAFNKAKENAVAITSSDILSSESGSSPLTISLLDENRDLKNVHKKSSEKDDLNSENKSSDATLDKDNYSIKTRQKGSTFFKKSKSVNVKKRDINQNVDSSSIAKFKHPRACRKSNKRSEVPAPTLKPDPVKETKKCSKPNVKQKEQNSENNKIPLKFINSIKKPSKACLKQKSKMDKVSSKSNIDGKMIDIKTKKNKFNVENFLQGSPSSCNITDCQTLTHEKVPSIENNNFDTVVKFSNSSISFSKKTVKSSSKFTKCKNTEKLRRSVRCSERASSLNQAELSIKRKSSKNSTGNKQIDSSSSKSTIEKCKDLVKKSVKFKSHIESLPITMEPPLQVLSPIPHGSPKTASISELCNQKKIMVCIPVSKLFRIPTILHQIQESDTRIPVKSQSVAFPEDLKSKKETSEKTLKTNFNKCSQLKDFKSKPRTVLNQRSKKKSVLVSTKENTSKALSDLSRSTTSVNKTSGKVADNSICDVENKLPKKRKAEGDAKQILKKKPKVSTRYVENKKSKELINAVKSELPAPQNDNGSKMKPLERCDSASSINSLCSQRSSKSLKDKKGLSVMQDSKRLKTSISTKENKQEKEERLKTHIKKEPLDKCLKSRDKPDNDCKEKGEMWNDNLNSSQYCHWDDICKEDSKIPLENVIDNLNRDSALNWDHFSPDMHKELREASGLKMLTDQGPIMPMDYYWTEGRKMKKMAETEKDPFQQAVKFFEAAVLYVLTSQQKEENCKNPDAVYQFYYETLSFTTMMLSKIKKLQSCPGSTEFKLLILCLKCQSLLNVKLYSLKIKEIKEQLEGVSDFFRAHCSSSIDIPNPNLPSLHQSRISNLSTVSSPHSIIPSTNTVCSQIESGTPLLRNSVCVPQSVLDTIYRQHTHFKNLHMGHDLWEQADMYMTRSNLKEFFKEVADQSEPLTLHSTIKELVSYMQKGIGLVKNYLR